MEKAMGLLLIGAIVGAVLYWLPGAIRRYRMEMEARRRLAAYVPGKRNIPLSAQDRRGWATDADGVIRPR